MDLENVLSWYVLCNDMYGILYALVCLRLNGEPVYNVLHIIVLQRDGN